MQNEKFTAEQISNYITEWQTSGLSKKAFCKLHEIKYHIFSYWFSKVTNQQTHDFVPIELESTNTEIVLSSPTGLQVKLPCNDSAIHILRQLLSC